MFRRSVLIVAFVMSLPVLWAALVDESVSLETAGLRFLIALPVAAILVALVRWAATPAAEPDSQEPVDENDAAAGQLHRP